MDLSLFNALRRCWGRSRALDAVVVFFAHTLTYLLAVGVFFFIILVGRSATQELFIFGEMLLAFLLARGVVATGIHAFFPRERPFRALGFEPPFMPVTSRSFPSGHMTGLFSVAFIMFTFSWQWGAVYMGLSLLVGLGRVIAGLHWPSDILGGILVGLGCGWIVHSFPPPHSFFTP